MLDVHDVNMSPLPAARTINTDAPTATEVQMTSRISLDECHIAAKCVSIVRIARVFHDVVKRRALLRRNQTRVRLDVRLLAQSELIRNHSERYFVRHSLRT